MVEKQVSIKVNFPDEDTEKEFKLDLEAWARQWAKNEIMSRRLKTLAMGADGQELAYINFIPNSWE